MWNEYIPTLATLWMPENQCPITMQFEHPYTHFSFLTLPYALCGSIKLYTSVESLECQKLAISYCRIVGCFGVDYYTHKFCGGVVWGYIIYKQVCINREYIYCGIDSYNCISIYWYSLARYYKFVVYITLDLLPWAGFFF